MAFVSRRARLCRVGRLGDQHQVGLGQFRAMLLNAGHNPAGAVGVIDGDQRPLRRAADNDDRPTQPRGRGGRPEVSTIMIRISISTAAYEAICTTLPIGNGAVEPEANAKGERTVWLEAAMVDLLFPLSATVLCSPRRG
jgi:hypothetical protein